MRLNLMRTIGVLGCVMALAGVAAADVERVELRDAKGVQPWAIRLQKKEMLGEGVTGTVRRTSFAVPKDWEGKFVRFAVPFPMVNMDAVLFLNGRRIGDVLRPAGELDVSRHLAYGATNEVALYCTFTGEGTDYGKCPLDYDMRRVHDFRCPAPQFLVSDGPVISDVFVNTSWRKKRLAVEVEVKEPAGTSRTGGTSKTGGTSRTLEAEILDQAGKLVKRAAMSCESCGSCASYALEIPWENPITWELGHPYLYTAKVRLGDFDLRTVRFGFRELWREGRELMMNGHKLHLRTHYSFGIDKYGAMFMRQMGYNCATYNHCTAPEGNADERTLEGLDEIGYGAVYSCGGLPTLCGWDFRTNTTRRAYVDRFVRHFHRMTRNHPSMIASYVTQMIICDIAFGPELIAQTAGRTDRHRLIDYVCDYHRQFNPNILYYSHADGSCGDIASGNMYLNWTPLQERVEWLNQWAEKGLYPWHGAEFGQPYGGCWYSPARLLCLSEHLARYFGNAAYEQEPMIYLEHARANGDTNPTWHGGKAEMEYGWHPLYWELHKLWCWQTNSRWRGNGHNGGNNYFNLVDAYGTPPDGRGFGRYGAPSMEKEAGRRPSWVNPNFDNFALGNQEFLGYIGGMPHHTDMTHSWYAGERVEKQAVMIWDGRGERRVTCAWKLKSADMRKLYASGSFEARLSPGEIVKMPFAFEAPDVKAKTDCALVLSFAEGLKTLWTDSLDVQFYPRTARPVRTPNGKPVALFDVTGEGAQILDALGVRYVKFDNLLSLTNFTQFSRLVIGKNALGETCLDSFAAKLKDGFRILILPQTPAVWQSLGFDVQDDMARILYAYDRTRKARFASLTDDMLSYWRGAPKYGEKPTGPVMVHKGGRGPRGSRNHTVAGLCLRVPDKVGYLPLICGEFDMNYTGLLRFSASAGGVWYCTLDFEDRMNVDPAATAVARAVLQDFLTGANPKPSAAAAPMAIALKAKAGFTTADGRIYRAEPLAGLGGELFRWTCPVVSPIGADGVFELKADQFRGQIGTEAQVKTNLAPAWAQMHVNRLFARKATLDGVQPSEADIRRAVYQSAAQPFVPFPAMHVVGPFVTDKDDSVVQMETVWNKQVEEMTVAGDFNPNYEFDLPQGGTANWRPLVYPEPDGRFSLEKLYPGASFPVSYAIAIVEREKEGDVGMLFGVDWQAKVWVNGERQSFGPGDWNRYGCAQGPTRKLTIHLKKGRNVVSFKTGSGRSGYKFWALLENEAKGAAAKREKHDELEKMGLYEDLVPDHDPNVFHWW